MSANARADSLSVIHPLTDAHTQLFFFLPLLCNETLMCNVLSTDPDEENGRSSACSFPCGERVKLTLVSIQCQWFTCALTSLLPSPLQLLTMTINNFIPREEREKITLHCHWDDESLDWRVDAEQLTGNSVRKPKSKKDPKGRIPKGSHS